MLAPRRFHRELKLAAGMRLDQNRGHDAVGAHIHVCNVLDGKEPLNGSYLKHVVGSLQERFSRMEDKLK